MRTCFPWLTYLLLALFLLGGCAVSNPALVHHPTPAFAANAAGLLETDSRITALGCERVEPDNLLGGLNPAKPIAWCRTGYHSGDGWVCRSCMWPICSNLVTWDASGYRLVGLESELRALYAPIESADEALSYAYAVTRLWPIYFESLPEGKRLRADTIEDTHVTETPDGYVVHLYSGPEPPCGCGSHTIYSVAVLVTRDGSAREQDRHAAWSESACMD